jgi:hypothetical protein
MTDRYVTRQPKAYIADDCAFGWSWTSGQPSSRHATIVAIDEAAGNVDTGLVDANGVKIFRTPERRPVGFVDLK